jgi:nucleoside-diphosphate-sugar epimerase
MKYLIIGGTGLISTPMSRFLLAQGEDVTLFNRGQHEMRFPQGVKVILGDRTRFTEFENQIHEAGIFDFVIDMVCFRPEEAESAVRTFKGRINHYVFCSTVDVYGKPGFKLPYKEDEPRLALTDYGKNKVLCENIFMAAHNQKDFNTTIIRPAATYGEGGTIIHTFGWKTTYLDRLRKGKPIVVSGDGNSLWVMCHVDDCARAHLAACGNPEAAGNAYHVTGEEWMTWNQYHQQVALAMNAPEPQLIHIPAEILYRLAPKQSSITYNNFQYSNIFDNSAAKRDLHFAYSIPFIEGVYRTVAWLDQNQRIENSDLDPFDDQLIFTWQEGVNQLIDQFTAKNANVL